MVLEGLPNLFRGFLCKFLFKRKEKINLYEDGSHAYWIKHYRLEKKYNKRICKLLSLNLLFLVKSIDDIINKMADSTQNYSVKVLI